MRSMLSGGTLSSLIAAQHQLHPTFLRGQKIASLASSGFNGYTPAQMRAAYGFDKVSFDGVQGDGSGQTIAIVDAYDDPCIAGDLQAFSAQFGLPQFVSNPKNGPTFTKMGQTGSKKALPVPDASGWSTEIALDCEWAHAIAPKANMILVEANSNSDTDLYAAVWEAASQKGVSVVSMSWGGPEYDRAAQAAYDKQFSAYVAKGVAFVASAGDSAGQVIYPSASAYVISVGGTSLTLAADNTVSSESAWIDSGGGPSAFEQERAWQQGVQKTGVRMTSDVAYNANPHTGVVVLDSWGGGWWIVGGTSAGSPQWAALLAIANQGRTLAKVGTLKAAIADLYAQTAYRDITAGYSCYYAQPGYDLPTGLGVPQADQLVPALVSYKEAKLAAAIVPATAPADAPAAKSSGAASAGAAHDQSTDIAGYEFAPNLLTVAANTVTAVTGSWQVPTLATASDRDQWESGVADYVGIDGLAGSSMAMPWIGTISYYNAPGSLRQVNNLWWDPTNGAQCFPVPMKIKTNDAINASVTYLGTNLGSDMYRLTITDTTQKTTFTAIGGYSGVDTNNGAIPPVNPSQPTSGMVGSIGIINAGRFANFNVALPKFATQNFSGVTATVKGSTGSQTVPFASLNTAAVDLFDSKGGLMAQTSNLGTDQSSFSVTWANSGNWNSIEFVGQRRSDFLCPAAQDLIYML
ncbi:MAG: hypothetical protein ABSF26_10295 [Thermoguttaceae bacterium]